MAESVFGRYKNNKTELLIRLLCSAMLGVITFWIVYKQTGVVSDYSVHADWTINLAVKWRRVTYPMWHILVWCMYKLLSLLGVAGIRSACALVTALVNVGAYWCVVYTLDKRMEKHVGLVAGALCLVGPIYIPWYSASAYLGQGSPNIWHNPTNIMVKPIMVLAIVLIIEICDTIQDRKDVAPRKYVVLAVLIMLSTLAKPSFFQGIVPALGIYIVIRLVQDKMKTFIPYLWLCVSFVPGFAIIVFQFVMAFVEGNGSEGVGIGWMEACPYTRNWLVSLLLVTLFPLCYFLCNFDKVRKVPRAQLLILYLISGWLQNQLLYEIGPTKNDGNFTWALQLAYAAVWIYATREFFGGWTNTKKDRGLLVVWTLHLICGIIYVGQLVLVPGMLF